MKNKMWLYEMEIDCLYTKFLGCLQIMIALSKEVIQSCICLFMDRLHASMAKIQRPDTALLWHSR